MATTGISSGWRALPLVFSLIGDLFPAHRRSHASALGCACRLGSGWGKGSPGTSGASTGGGRRSWNASPMPRVIVGFLFLASVKEPKRGIMDGNSYSSDDLVGVAAAPAAVLIVAVTVRLAAAATGGQNNKEASVWEQIKTGAQTSWISIKWVLAVPTNKFALLQGIPGCVPWSVINAFMNDYLATNKGVRRSARPRSCSDFSLGGFLGMVFGGILGQKRTTNPPGPFATRWRLWSSSAAFRGYIW